MSSTLWLIIQLTVGCFIEILLLFLLWHHVGVYFRHGVEGALELGACPLPLPLRKIDVLDEMALRGMTEKRWMMKLGKLGQALP